MNVIIFFGVARQFSATNSAHDNSAPTFQRNDNSAHANSAPRQISAFQFSAFKFSAATIQRTFEYSRE
jgi:hypothetical protein